MLLSTNCPASKLIPGWPEFCIAEGILSRLPWLSNGDIPTIQCLLIKARFLSTIQRMRSAYHTMCKVVQICFHIGLHNQPTWWSALSPFEVVMRQRIFWSMFYLACGMAHNVGLPPLIRASDVNVDFPGNIDDQCLFPHRPLPLETPANSYTPYLASLVKWADLSSNIWDDMFSARAAKPASEELIASLDADILLSVCKLPSSLQWDPISPSTNSLQDVPPYVRRQMWLSHLVCNTPCAHPWHVAYFKSSTQITSGWL